MACSRDGENNMMATVHSVEADLVSDVSNVSVEVSNATTNTEMNKQEEQSSLPTNLLDGSNSERELCLTVSALHNADSLPSSTGSRRRALNKNMQQEALLIKRAKELEETKAAMARQAEEYEKRINQMEQWISQSECTLASMAEEFNRKIRQQEDEKLRNEELFMSQITEYEARMQQLILDRNRKEQELNKRNENNQKSIEFDENKLGYASERLTTQGNECMQMLARMQQDESAGDTVTEHRKESDEMLCQVRDDSRSKAEEYETKLASFQELKLTENDLKQKEQSDIEFAKPMEKNELRSSATRQAKNNATKSCPRQHKRPARKILETNKPSNSTQHSEVEATFIRSLQEVQTVYGMAILNNELFLGFYDGNELAVYDAQTWILRRRQYVPQLSCVIDMAACDASQRVYIADYLKNEIIGLQVDGRPTRCWPVYTWPQGVAVNAANNVLVTCFRSQQIKEFTGDGVLIREITMDVDILHPMQTVEVSPDQFVVCHGLSADLLSRVCVVSEHGKPIRSYGSQPGSGLGRTDWPVSVASDGSSVLVADFNNSAC